MKVKSSTLYSLLYALIVFIYSIFLLPFYSYGDQTHYRNFYENCFYSGSDLEQQLDCYRFTLSTQEPIYFFIVKFANPLMSKDVFIALSNSFLAFILVKLIYKYYNKTTKIHFFIILILTNYYTNVLFFAAERLKFAFIFLVLTLLLNSKKSILITRFLMVFTHLQMILALLVIMLSEFFSKNSEISLNKRRLNKIILVTIGIISLVAVYLQLQTQLTAKFEGSKELASESGKGLVGFIKALAIMVLTFLSTKKFLPLVIQLPLLIAATLLGASRIIIMNIILYIITVVYYKKQSDHILTLVLIYFSYKTVGFIENIYKYGSGYL